MPPIITDVWNFILVHPIISLLVGAYDLVHDFGLAIVLVTIAIRLVLYPLFVTQIRNQRAMQELAPAMADLKAKYGTDRQRLTQEQMKLYKERGYNPAMGCLPVLLQMPLLIALYAAFQQAPTLTGDALNGILMPFVPNPLGPEQHLDLAVPWLPWLTGLGEKSNPLEPGIALPERLGLAILPLLAGGLQLVSSVMFQPKIQPKVVDQQQKMMQTMTYYFPLITVYFATQFPAGLAIYWVTTTLFGIVQQYFVSGWGQLPRFLPFLVNIPSPADRTLAARQQAALAEERKDMAALAATNGPGAQNTRERQSRARGRRKKKKG